MPHDEGAYMLEVDGERHIYVVDLRSGERNMIEGALWPDVDWPYAELVGSPEGDKLALIQRDATIMVDNNVTDETGHNTGDSWYYLYRIY